MNGQNVCNDFLGSLRTPIPHSTYQWKIEIEYFSQGSKKLKKIQNGTKVIT